MFMLSLNTSAHRFIFIKTWAVTLHFSPTQIHQIHYFDRWGRRLSLHPYLSPSSKNAKPSRHRWLTTSIIGIHRDASSSSIQMVCASSSFYSIFNCLGLFVIKHVLISLRLNFVSGQVLGGATSPMKFGATDCRTLLGHQKGEWEVPSHWLHIYCKVLSFLLLQVCIFILLIHHLQYISVLITNFSKNSKLPYIGG